MDSSVIQHQNAVVDAIATLLLQPGLPSSMTTSMTGLFCHNAAVVHPGSAPVGWPRHRRSPSLFCPQMYIGLRSRSHLPGNRFCTAVDDFWLQLSTVSTPIPFSRNGRDSKQIMSLEDINVAPHLYQLRFTWSTTSSFWRIASGVRRRLTKQLIR